MFFRNVLLLQTIISAVGKGICDWPCVYPPPCTCNYVGSSIDCSRKGLTTVPPIMNELTGKQWNIDLSYNNITKIPDGTFGNLTFSNVYLNHNQIYALGDNVFRGSERTMFSLYLQFNRLTYLPTAFGKLINLFELNIQGNPIVAFNEDVLRNMSSLAEFSFGSSLITKWPYEIKSLSKADWISIYGINIAWLPDDAFKKLFILNITGTKLEALSNTLSNREGFVELDLQDNPLLTAAGLEKGEFKNLPKFRKLSIINCGLETLPPIFDGLTDLGELILTGNPITEIADSTFPANFTKMFQIYIEDSLLERVPPTLSRLTKLNNIYLRNNKIGTIDDSDFHGFSELFQLFLSGNPVANISDNAFKSLDAVDTLDLGSTKMTTIPKAIRNMPSLHSLYMSGSPVQCSCTNLRWMKEWLPTRKDAISVIGDCSHQNRTIQDFLNIDIPHCV